MSYSSRAAPPLKRPRDDYDDRQPPAKRPERGPGRPDPVPPSAYGRPVSASQHSYLPLPSISPGAGLPANPVRHGLSPSRPVASSYPVAPERATATTRQPQRSEAPEPPKPVMNGLSPSKSIPPPARQVYDKTPSIPVLVHFEPLIDAILDYTGDAEALRRQWIDEVKILTKLGDVDERLALYHRADCNTSFGYLQLAQNLRLIDRRDVQINLIYRPTSPVPSSHKSEEPAPPPSPTSRYGRAIRPSFISLLSAIKELGGDRDFVDPQQLPFKTWNEGLTDAASFRAYLVRATEAGHIVTGPGGWVRLKVTLESTASVSAPASSASAPPQVGSGTPTQWIAPLNESLPLPFEPLILFIRKHASSNGGHDYLNIGQIGSMPNRPQAFARAGVQGKKLKPYLDAAVHNGIVEWDNGPQKAVRLMPFYRLQKVPAPASGVPTSAGGSAPSAPGPSAAPVASISALPPRRSVPPPASLPLPSSAPPPRPAQLAPTSYSAAQPYAPSYNARAAPASYYAPPVVPSYPSSYPSYAPPPHPVYAAPHPYQTLPLPPPPPPLPAPPPAGFGQLLGILRHRQRPPLPAFTTEHDLLGALGSARSIVFDQAGIARQMSDAHRFEEYLRMGVAHGMIERTGSFVRLRQAWRSDT